MPHGLQGEEDRIEHDGGRREQHRLPEVQCALERRRKRAVGQDERNGRERNEHREIGARSFKVVLLLNVQEPAGQQASPDHAVHHDHDDGEHRVARQRRVGHAFEHHRGNERHPDEDDGDGEDERAERLAEKFSQRVGVTNDAEDAARDGRQQPREQHAALDELRRIGEPRMAVQEEQAERQRAEKERHLAADTPLPALLARHLVHPALSCRHRACLRH